MDESADLQAGCSGAEVEARAREAIQKHIHREEVRLDHRTESWRIGGHRGRSFTSKEVGAQVWVHHSYIPKGVFVAILEEMAWKLRQAEIDKVATGLDSTAGAEECRAELSRFVGLICHEETDAAKRRYYELAVAQLIWQVRRRLAGKPTNTDIMLVLSGGQGTGKSTAIRHLSKILSFLCVPDGTFKIFSDSFRQGILESAYLIVLDEMEQGSKTDIEAVKRNISSPILQGRAMHSQTEVTRIRNASFIGATNLSLDAHVRDATGMRRFVELRFRDAKVSDEWLRELRGIEWQKVWSCTHQTTDKAPLQAAAAMVEKEQARLVSASSFETWYEECVCQCEHAEKVEFKDVFQNYLQWADTYRDKPLSYIAFGRLMDRKHEFYRPGNRKTYSGIRLSTYTMAKPG